MTFEEDPNDPANATTQTVTPVDTQTTTDTEDLDDNTGPDNIIVPPAPPVAEASSLVSNIEDQAPISANLELDEDSLQGSDAGLVQNGDSIQIGDS